VQELLDAPLPLRRPDVAAEVLADDDVDGQLRPALGDLDVLLLEDGLARLMADAGGPGLPLDLVVGMDARRGPSPWERQAADALAFEAGSPRPAEARRGWGGRCGGLGGPLHGATCSICHSARRNRRARC